MLLLVAIEHLRYMFFRQDKGWSTARPPFGPASNTQLPAHQAIVDAPVGTRYQLLRALRAMAKGEFMVVAHKIPQISKQYLEDDDKRAEWFRSLRNTDSWNNRNEIEPVMVPGTAYPDVIGRIIIRAGWCAPVDQPHWVPNLRFFFLTDIGLESLHKTQAWWLELTLLERLRLMFLE